MSPIEVCGVAPAHAAALWPLVLPCLEPAFAHGYDRYWAPDDVRALCLAGRAQLWVACTDRAIEAAAVTRIVDYPRCRILEVPLVGGSFMRRWLVPLQELIERFARDHGCTRLEGGGRPGWARAAGFSNLGPHLVKEL